jgi:S-adenosylmethionine synthetase
MCLIFARIVGLPHGHIVPDDKPPSGELAVARPKDCRLYTGETEALLDRQGLECVLFEEWWQEHLCVTQT